MFDIDFKKLIEKFGRSYEVFYKEISKFTSKGICKVKNNFDPYPDKKDIIKIYCNEKDEVISIHWGSN